MTAAIAMTVVMPSLDQGAYLARAVRSVLSQSRADVELVVVDGGSRDHSLTVLADLAQEFPGRLRWFSGPDDGPADAVNHGVRLARGQIIGWLNSDDLYAGHAIKRVLAFFRRNPECVLVYGHGRHIDAKGRTIDDYPTAPPSVGVARFADGCFICQPTAFFRKEAFEALGGLDASLRASFDFDLWVRMFLRYPGRIGFIPKVQAYSRLHEQGITHRFRERVALEGVQVVARHLGGAPAHWLLTHYDELCAIHPFGSAPRDLQAELKRLVEQATPHLSESGLEVLRRRLSADRNLLLSSQDFYAQIYPDGWAPPQMDLRVRQGSRPVTEIRLNCVNALPKGKRLRLEIVSPAEGVMRMTVEHRGGFEISLPISEQGLDSRLIYRVRSRDWFVPAKVRPGSTDVRKLAFLVEGCDIVRQ